MKSTTILPIILLILLAANLASNIGVIFRQNTGNLFLSKATLCVYEQPTNVSCSEYASRSLSILEDLRDANPLDLYWLNLILGNLDQASVMGGKISREQEDPITLLRFIRLGDLYLAASMWKYSEIAYRGVLILYPDRADPYLKLARLYLAQERYQDALTLLDHGIAASPKDLSRLLLQKGFVYFRTGDFQAALEEFIRCRTSNNSQGGLAYSEPNQLHYFTGEALLRLGQLEQAIPEYALAIQLDPNLDWPWPTYAAYVGLGDVYLRQKDFTKARAAYEQAYSIALEGDQQNLVLGRLEYLKATEASPY